MLQYKNNMKYQLIVEHLVVCGGVKWSNAGREVVDTSGGAR
jgi:hypothetical protein